MEHRQADYSILERQALVLLSAQDATDPQHDIFIAHVSVMPSFENYVSWQVCSNDEQTEFMAKRLLWDRVFDSRRFFDPMAGLKYGWNTAPTIRQQESMLPSPDVNRLLGEARSIDVPEPVQTNVIVLDGANWRVSVAQAFGNKPRTWNVEPPEWRPLIEWTARFVKFVDDHLEKNA